MNFFYFEDMLDRRPTRGSSIYMFFLPLGWSHPILKNYYQYYVGVIVILMQLVQLSELPEDPEPSSIVGACILRIICLRLLASLSVSGCALIQFFNQNAQCYCYEIGLCLAGLLMASVNTAMQSYFCGSFIFYGIEFVKLKSKRSSAKQATDWSPGLFNTTNFNSTFGVLRLPVYY